MGLGIATLQREIDSLSDLIASPGWTIIRQALMESEQEYDQELHRVPLTDIVRAQTCQTTCKVLRDVLATPARLLQDLQAKVESEEAD